jgi:transcriptional regulator with XRE-family HTH domain
MIRERIQEAVQATGLSQREIARATGLSESGLSRFNRGLRSMSLAALDQLLARLGLEIVIRPRRNSRKDD